MIVCNNVCKKFNNGGDFFAVNQVSLNIKEGEFVALCGKSGSGKSTLLNLIGLIDEMTSGSLCIGGVDTTDMSQKERARLRNTYIGYIFQAFYLDSHYTVAENVEMPLLIANVPKKERIERVNDCLVQVGMVEKRNQRTGDLSGGEKQRVCIARALANRPRIILADEPCGNLDSENTTNIMQIFQELHKKGTTILMVTHSAEDAKYAERVITMKDGKIIENEV